MNNQKNQLIVLIAEDSATQAEQLRHLLEVQGYAVHVASNGREGFSMAREIHPTIIITDIVMPEMDGYALSSAIKSDEAMKDIPVILVTQLSNPGDVLRGLECGADSFITKPYDQKYLLTRIRYILANRELRLSEKTQMGVEILFGSKKYFITAERQQILDLLISTYEAAVEQNLELAKTQEALRMLNEKLEQKVWERTAALEQEVENHKWTEEKLEKVNRELRTISECNQALVRSAGEPKLFDDICLILVSIGGYRMAWVGFISPEKGNPVAPVAFAGHEEGYLKEINHQKSDFMGAQDEKEEAWQSGRYIIIHDFQKDSREGPWREEALRRGYRSAIYFPLVVDRNVIAILCIYSAEPDAFKKEEISLLTELSNDLAFGIKSLRTEAERKKVEEKLQESLNRLEKIHEGTVQAISSMLETRDPYTAGHQQRVTQLACAIAGKLGLTENRIEGLRIAGILHDIGKIYVPAEILSKPGRLSDIEFNMIKTHSQAGYDILKNIDFPWPIAQIVIQHHERDNGSGYPQGLKADVILLEAKILAVADVVEAMSSHRPYRAALGIDKALEEISRNKAVLYDPHVAEACTNLFLEKAFSFK